MAYQTKSEIILDRLRQDILTRKLKPGVKIDQVHLKDELGVSMIPLREAFKRLQSEGFLTIVPHRGAFVKPLSPDEIEDLYMVRAEVEVLAARLAVPRLDEKSLDKLKKLFEDMKGLTRSGAYKDLLRLNRKFHYTIYEACGRTHLLEILNELWMRSSRYRTLVTAKPERAMAALDEHGTILKACIEKDSNRLSDAIRHNVAETRKMLREDPDLADLFNES